MQIIKAYEYLYYRIYLLQLHWFGKEDFPEWSSTISVSVFIWINFIGIISLISILTGVNIEEALTDNKIKIVPQYFFILLINSLIFIRNKRYEKIALQFSNETGREKKIKLILIYVYLFLSVSLLFVF